MLFNSIEFLLFFPLVCICYFLIPHAVRYIFLLVCSYYFYMCWNPKYALLMLTSTIITYLSGLLLEMAEKDPDEKRRTGKKNLFTALSFTSNLLILFFFKYFNFAANTLVRVFSLAGIHLSVPTFDILLPVGISFYTFQALSYTMDVYRREIKAEKNFLRYALFVSFFPQLVAGPIERSKNLLSQLSERHTFDYVRVRMGLTRMLYGMFQKIVLAEYLAIIVNNVYNDYSSYNGFQLMAASICFAFQIYCDFGSYSNIAIGAAQVMGFTLMENFDTPYFSTSVSEFWRRWHISLSTWFRDYLYFPLGGSRKGTLRKHINRMIVFLVSGLWHGASGHFVLWGFLNGLYQVIEDICKPLKKKFFHGKENMLTKLLHMILTFILIDISWVFFRATTSDGIHILKKIFTIKRGWFGGKAAIAGLGMSYPMIIVLLAALCVLFIVDLCRYNKMQLLIWLDQKNFVIRWIVYFALIFAILIFGIYGPTFDASQFIYFQF